MIDGYRQVNLRVSTLQKLQEYKQKFGLNSLDAVVKKLIESHEGL